jgi:hypothetical protein
MLSVIWTLLRRFMIVSENLGYYDPVAYAFLDTLTLNEEQFNELESTINEEGDPLAGARVWTENNRDVLQPWVEAAGGRRSPRTRERINTWLDPYTSLSVEDHS